MVMDAIVVLGKNPTLAKLIRGEPVAPEELAAYLQARDDAAKRNAANYARDAASALARIAARHPGATSVEWFSAGCPDCQELNGKQWDFTCIPLGHDTALVAAPPLGLRCRGILIPHDHCTPAVYDAIRRKDFAAALLVIDTMRRDKGSVEFRKLKAEVEGRRQAHDLGQRFMRKKHLPPEFQ